LRCLSQDVLQQLLLVEANLKAKSYNEIVEILKTQFAGGASSQAAAMEKLKHLQQKEGQPAREFAAELMKLAGAAKVTSEDLRITHFLAVVFTRTCFARMELQSTIHLPRPLKLFN